jgi:branched-chain amino acid transport system substrate-binding protein
MCFSIFRGRLFLAFLLVASACTTSSHVRDRRSKNIEKVEADELKSQAPVTDPLESATRTPVPESFRQYQDSGQLLELYQNGQRTWEAGDRRRAIQIWEKYLAASPESQYADAVSLRFAEEAQDRFDDQTAIGYCNRVLQMTPPSRLRGEALYLRAISERRLGNVGKALESLSQIRFAEVDSTKSPQIFFFWGEAAGEAGRWLESTLAYSKVYYTDSDAQRKATAEKFVSDHVDRKLGEPELNFLLKEYSNSFPNQQVRLRLVSIYLARGDRSAAEGLLNDILGTSSPNSEVYRNAQALLARFESLGDVSTSRIGVLLPLSGRREGIGKAIADGLKLAVEGMDKERRIEFVFGDTGPTLDTAKVAFERLLFDERVMSVIGPIQGDAADYVATRCSEFGVPNITLAARSGIVDRSPFVFRLASTPEKETQALVKYAVKNLGATRFGILFSRASYGEVYADAYFKAVEENGGIVTAAESYLSKQTDFFTQLDNMTGLAFPEVRKAEFEALLIAEKEKAGRELTRREISRLQLPPIVDFDVLFIPDVAEPVGQIVPALPYRNITGVRLMGPSMWNSPKLLQRAGQYLNGALFVDAFSPTRTSVVTRNFSEQFQIKFGKVPTAMSAIGYDVGVSLRKLYEKVGVPTSRESFRSRLSGLGEIDGSLGLLRWDSNRDALAEVQLFQIKRGAFAHETGVR